MRDYPLAASHAGQPVSDLVGGIEVVELADRKQRQWAELRNYVNELLDSGWQIATRNPLTLQRGPHVCYVLHGMLISESLI